MEATRRRPKVWRTLTSDDDVTLNEWCRRRTFQQIDTDNTSLSHESRYRTSNVSGNKGSLQVQVCLHEQCHGMGYSALSARHSLDVAICKFFLSALFSVTGDLCRKVSNSWRHTSSAQPTVCRLLSKMLRLSWVLAVPNLERTTLSPL